MSKERPDCPAIRIRLFVAAACLFSLTACIGIVVRMAVQDHDPVLAAVFYMLFPASICACAVLAGLLFRAGRNSTGAGRMILVGVACAVWCVTFMFHFHAQTDRTAEAVRVVFCNVYRAGHSAGISYCIQFTRKMQMRWSWQKSERRACRQIFRCVIPPTIVIECSFHEKPLSW
jgi:hypothetical protein